MAVLRKVEIKGPIRSRDTRQSDEGLRAAAAAATFFPLSVA
jgi:hypothetical protein